MMSYDRFTLFQILHIIDSVLEPLVPISLRDAEYFVKLDARKLLTKSTLYELGGHRTRTFYQQTDENRSRLVPDRLLKISNQ